MIWLNRIFYLWNGLSYFKKIILKAKYDMRCWTFRSFFDA